MVGGSGVTLVLVAVHLEPSHLAALKVEQLMKIRSAYDISSQNDPNITYTKSHIYSVFVPLYNHGHGPCMVIRVLL